MISPTNYAYQFRVDILPIKDISGDVNILKKHYSLQLCKMVTQEEFADWLCCYEVSDNGKHHYQCILWKQGPVLTQKQRDGMKAKYFRENKNSKNAISFTDAKKIVNLTAYVLKDQEEMDEKNYPNNNIITTLTLEQIQKIPTWLTKHALKNQWKKELEDEILLIISEDVYGRRPTKIQFAKQVIKFHIDNQHPPPSKLMLFKLLLKYLPSYTEENYLVDIGFIQQY